MSQAPGLKFEIGHALFIDLVGYSKLLIEAQKERLRRLTAAFQYIFRPGIFSFGFAF